MFPANRVSRWCGLFVLIIVQSNAYAAPGDEVVESYLRANRMDSLLETQLESRLNAADDEQDREELAESLSELYLRLLRELAADDPYRELLLNRARALVTRLDQVPMYELRLELHISSFSAHEHTIELHRLALLDPLPMRDARDAFIGARRGLELLLSKLEPELARLDRRRTQPLSGAESREVESEIESLRRERSLAYYYLGWIGYGIAVLDDRNVGDDVFVAFGWLLGAEGGMPQSKDIAQAALEYEHVARSALGVALCYAQSGADPLAIAWIDAILNTPDVSPEVLSSVRSRKLQVLADSGSWYDTNVLAREMIRERGEDGALSVAEARFIAIRALDARSGRSGAARNPDDADAVAKLGVEQLVDLGEIGHVVDLYQRYQSLPTLKDSFISNYARALASLEQAESGVEPPAYLALAEEFSQALKSGDSGAYPKHHEDCLLKLAYTLIRGDRPSDALTHCQRVIDTSLNQGSIEEARWLGIAAHDRVNTLNSRSSSPELDQAVRAYVRAYPTTERATKLVLRHAMRGTLDEQFAIETLRSIGDNDPIAIPARRTLVQLQYQRLRARGFDDQQTLRDTRELIAWLLEHADPSEDENALINQIAVLRIGIDLAIRAEPPDASGALHLVESAESMVALSSAHTAIEAELLYRRVQIMLIDERIDEAIAYIDRLAALDIERSRSAEVLILNVLLERWAGSQDRSTARYLVELGSPVVARMTPKAPQTISVQTSALIEMIAHAAITLGEPGDEDPSIALALRLSKQVLERGQPSEAGLRRTAQIARDLGDHETQLDAWLRLLAAIPPDDERWFEARYESLVVMLRLDPARARATYEQYRVLHPTIGHAPWGQRIVDLFTPSAGSDGGLP